jgi:hypothetical protein
MPVSLVFILVARRLIIGWSGISRPFASRFLGTLCGAEIEREVKIVLAERDTADAFDIHRDLEDRIGRGPFLSATRVQAALLRLRASEEVIVNTTATSRSTP